MCDERYEKENTQTAADSLVEPPPVGHDNTKKRAVVSGDSP